VPLRVAPNARWSNALSRRVREKGETRFATVSPFPMPLLLCAGIRWTRKPMPRTSRSHA